MEELYFPVVLLYTLLSLIFPELNLVLLLVIGRIAYEPRLGFFGYYSLNHINLLILPVHLAWTVRSRSSRRSLRFDQVNIYLLFFLWMCLNFLFLSDNMEYGFDKIVVTLFVAFLTALTAVIRYRYLGDRSIRNTLVFLTLVSMGMAVGGFFSLFVLGELGRTSILGGGPIVFARFVGFSIITLIVFYRFLTRRVPRLFVILAIIFLLIVHISALSKGPILSLYLTVGIFLFLMNERGDRSRFVRNSVVMAASGVSLVGLIFLLGMAERYFLSPFTEVSYGSYGLRIEHYLNSFWAFLESPLVGIGLGNYAYFGKGFDYPHNIFLEILSELGIVGLLIFLMIIVPFMKAVISYRRFGFPEPASLYTKTFLLLAVFMLLNQQVSGDMMDARFLWFALILGNVTLLNSPVREVEH